MLKKIYINRSNFVFNAVLLISLTLATLAIAIMMSRWTSPTLE